MGNRQLIFLLLALALFAPVLFATNTSNQFEAELPANSQTDAERATLVQEGLKQVLVNVSGRERILQNPKIKSSLNKADKYVQEYRYSSSAVRDASTAKYLFTIRFNKQDVMALLGRAGYKPKTTPESTHWLKLHVSRILKSNDIDELISNLKHLESVHQVELSLLSGDMVEVAVLVHGSEEDFLQSATVVRRLSRKSQEPVDNTFIYEWTE